MNCKLSALIILASIACASCSDPCPWAQYLGNAGRTGNINCNGPDSPEILWKAGLECEPDSPTIFGSEVIIFSGFSSSYVSLNPEGPKPNVAVIDLLTGEILRKIVLGRGMNNAYPLEKDRAIGESSHHLYEIDLLSQENRIVSERILGSVLCDSLRYYPVILSDRVVFPTTPVVCISKSDFRILWDLRTSLGLLYPQNGAVLNIAASENRTYVIIDEEKKRGVWAVTSDTGTLVWAKEFPKVLSFVAVDGSVLFLGGNGLLALNAETGDLIWEGEAVDVISNIVAGPDTVYFASFDNYVYAIDKFTGTLKWRTQWKGSGHWITHVVGAGDTVILSNAENLYSFSAKDGTQLWEYHFYSEIEMCAATSDGIVVVGEKMTHELVAFASNPELYVKQGDAFVSKGQKERAGQSYGKAFSLFEKKGEIARAEEIKKKAEELGIPLKSLPASQSPSLSSPPSVSLSPSTSPESVFHSVQESDILITSTIVVISILIAIHFFKRKS